MAWVWEHSRAAPTERLVLLAIADCANDRGEAWPSMAALVDKTRLSERTVQRAVSTLVSLGELSAVIGGGRGRTTRYRLIRPEDGQTPPEKPRNPTPDTPTWKPRNVDGEPEKPRQPVKETPSTSAVNPVTVTPGTIREPSREPSKTKTTSSSSRGRATTDRGSRLPDDFDATPDMIAWAREHTPLVGTKETAGFVDYWRAQPGAKGRKTDWTATWRNWMRKAQTDAESRRGRTNSRASPLVEVNGIQVTPETAKRMTADRDRLAAMDAAERQHAIEGPT